MNANEEKILYEIASALKTIAAQNSADNSGSSIVTKLDSIASKLDTIATKLNAIDGHLNPLYQADYTAPEAAES